MNKKYGLLVLIIVISITLIVSFNNKTINKLDEVKLNEKESEMFAIMLQNDTGYEESSNNEWPDYKYKFNKELSGCIDKNGDRIKEETLTFDEETRKATVETSKTSYCYLYFDKLTAPGTKLEGYSNLSYDLKGGMYRYQGDKDTVDNNYICFGTSEKETCTSNPDLYMYRIIGIVGEDCTNKDTQLCDDTVSKDMIKVIKQTPLKEGSTNVFQWHTGYQGDQYADILYDNSQIKKRLNGGNVNSTPGQAGGTNIFLGTTSTNYNILYPYLNPDDTTWTNKIVNKKWYVGNIGFENVPNSAEEMFNEEHGITEAKYYLSGSDLQSKKMIQSSESFKIGLMNLSDYYWSISSEGIDCRNGNYELCSKSWLHSKNNNGNSDWEWLFTSSGHLLSTEKDYRTWFIFIDGHTALSNMNGVFLVRPVFYLNTNVTISSGTGIFSDPFIIA